MAKAAYVMKVKEMHECSKLWRWFDGMVPSLGSNGWWFVWPRKSSTEIESEEPIMIKRGSKYLGLDKGNHISDMYDFGCRENSLMWLKRCQRPSAKKKKPGTM